MPEINIYLGDAEGNGDFERVLEELREQIAMRAGLPQLMSRAVLAGHREKVLDALVSWGSGSKTVRQIWGEMAALLPGEAVERAAVDNGASATTQHPHMASDKENSGEVGCR